MHNSFRILFLMLVVYSAFVARLHADAKDDAKMIAKAMRGIQGKYRLLRIPEDQFEIWPDCINGTEAPAFPSDTFYAADCEDPQRGLELVEAVRAALYRIQVCFIDGANIAGKDLGSDLSPKVAGLEAIDESNYVSKLGVIIDGISKLKYISLSWGYADARWTRVYSDNAISIWTGSGWDVIYGDVDLERVVERFDNGSWGYGLRFLGTPGRDCYPLPPSPGSSMKMVQFLFEKAAIQVNLPDFVGNGSIYLGVTGHGSAVETAPVEADEKWHLYTGFSTEGDVWKSDVIGGETPVPGVDVADADTWWLVGGVLAVLELTENVSTEPDAVECCNCITECKPGGTTASNSSLGYRIDLGAASTTKTAGSIFLRAEVPTPQLSKISALRFPLSNDYAEFVYNWDLGGNSPRQILVPQMLVDLVTISDYKYEVRLYPRGSETWDYETQIYSPGGSPFKTITVENPDASSETFNRIKITESEGGNTEVAEFVYTALNNEWEMITGSGERSEILSKSWNVAKTERTEVRTIKNSAATSVSKTTQVYRIFPWGEELVQEVEDPDGAALSTTWSFYDDKISDGANYGRLKQFIPHDGPWERYVYDSGGRLWKTVRQYLDGAVGASESASRVVSETYSVDGRTQTIVETVLGQEVSRRYRTSVTTSGVREVREAVCTVVGASSEASTNLVTTTVYSDKRVQSITHPNGTMTLYSYEGVLGGGRKTIVAAGVANNSGTAIISGTRTETITDQFGHQLSEEVFDIASGLLLTSATTTTFDDFGRPKIIQYDDGSTEEKTYDCCGVESQKDRNGGVTNYTYDSLKRVLTESRDGITTLYNYDASGRRLKMTRRGSDSSDIVTETLTYDLAGRVTSRKDALNQITTYDDTINGSGQKVRTTTLPGGSTQVEVTHCDGQQKEISGTAAHPVKYEYGTASGGLQFVKTIRVGEGGSENEWTKTYTDMAGRQVKVEYSGGAEEAYHYNALGQLTKQVDADGIARLYAYNDEGEQIEQAIDTDDSGTINGGDRRTKTFRSVIAGPLIRTVTQQGSDSGYVTVSTSDASPNGRYQKVTQHGLETVTQTTYASNGDSTQVTTHPDGSTSTTEYENGRPVANQRKANGGAVIASTAYEYDPHGRLWKQTDGRVGTQTTYTYNDADQTTSVNAGGMVTSYTHNDLGQVITETLPGSGRAITRTYRPTGEVLTEGGSATYPITYTYDPQGRRRTMVTSSGTTTWNYSGTRVWLDSKVDAQNEATSYTYTPAGRLKTRTWARGVVTTYGYNGAGELSSVSYSDGTTPGVTYSYDSQGRPRQITDASGTRTMSYNAAGQLESESISGGILNGVSLSATYDSLLRRDSFTATRNSTALASSSFTYDGASRLATVSSGDQTAAYNYLAGSSLVDQIAFKQNGTPAMTTTKSYDGLNRLKSISSAPAVGDPMSYAYDYNAAGQRDQMTLANGDTWKYGYNDRGEVKSGSKKQGGTTDLLGYQFAYDFDDLGNRTSTITNGRTSTYSTNSLNQYTSRTVPGYADVIGKAKPTTLVTVNTLAATRQGEEYHKELSADNSAAPVYLSTSVKGTLGSDTAEVNGKLFIPKTPEAFAYDKDGNLLSDGRWTYRWDGENRLIGMETQASAATAGAPKQRLTFVYDQQGRRISKKVEDWKGSRYQERFTMLFLYDGWNLAAEVLAVGPKIRSYVWGSDLSGGSAAGGVGGLLFIEQYPEAKIYSVGYDGNGNVTGLFDMEANGEIASLYENGPFGESLCVNEMMALINPIGFSSKYTDIETGFVYYGYRYYNPNSGRWLSADPIADDGGVNLYGMCGNQTISKFDKLGLLEFDKSCRCYIKKEIRRAASSQVKKFRAKIRDALFGDRRAIYKFRSLGLTSNIGILINNKLGIIKVKCHSKLKPIGWFADGWGGGEVVDLYGEWKDSDELTQFIVHEVAHIVGIYGHPSVDNPYSWGTSATAGAGALPSKTENIPPW